MIEQLTAIHTRLLYGFRWLKSLGRAGFMGSGRICSAIINGKIFYLIVFIAS
jgi:hypothetical protein